MLLGLAVWAGVYARVALSPLQETMRDVLSLTDNEVALLQGSSSALAIVLGSVPVGLLIDRYSRAKLILVFIGAAILGSVFSALAPTFALLFAARAVVGLAAIALLIAAYSLMADLYTAAQRGRATIVVSSSELGLPAAFAVGGMLIASYGPRSDGWRWSVLWMTLPPLVIVFLLMLTLREPPRTGQVRRNLPVREAFRVLWRYRPMIIPLLGARVVVGVADSATLIWSAPMFTRRFALPPDRVGVIMAAVSLASGITSSVVGGLLADICHRSGGPRRTTQALGVLAVLSVPTGLFAIAPSVPITTVLLIAFVGLGFTANVAGAALSTVVVPNEVRGTFLSISMVAGALFGVALAPLMVSLLSEFLGGPAMIGSALTVVCVVFSTLGAILFTFGSRVFPRV